MATVDEVVAGTLGDFNVGLAGAVGIINPLAAQLDAAIGLSLSFQLELSASLDASLALQATLGLGLNLDLAANLNAALDAVIALQAALSAGLSLGVGLELNAELSVAASLNAALTARLGDISLLIEAMIALKIPAIRAAASLAASLSLGGIVALVFDGLSDGTQLQTIGNAIQVKFQNDIGFPGNMIPKDHPVSGIIIVTDFAPSFSAMGSIFVTTPP